MDSEIDFKRAHYNHNYSKKSSSAFVRILSDLYSQENADNYNETRTYAAEFTDGKCFYCGKDLYHLKDGVPYFSNEVQYDHILPASLGGLYAKGNVVLACRACNGQKSNLSVEDYYQSRINQGLPTLYSLDELYAKVAIFQIPYRKEHSEFMGISLLALKNPDMLETSKLTGRLMEGINLDETLASSNVNLFAKSPNAALWYTLHDPDSAYYQDLNKQASQSITARIGSIFNNFIDKFSTDADITTVSNAELTGWANEMLVAIAEYSRSECDKVRRALRMLFEQLNQPFDNVYTYRNAKDAASGNLNNIKTKSNNNEQTTAIIKPYGKAGTFAYFDSSSPIYNKYSRGTAYTYGSAIKKLLAEYCKILDVDSEDARNVPVSELDIDTLETAIDKVYAELPKDKRSAINFFINRINKHFQKQLI